MITEKRKLATLPICYIPSLEFFWDLAHCHICILTDHLQYTKRSPVSISPPLLGDKDQLRIPVRHDGKKMPISQKRIDVTAGFYARHLKTLTHTFHNFPFGYYYLPQIEELINQHEESLSAYLNSWLSLMVRWLHLPVDLQRASQYNQPGTDEKFIVAICKEKKCNIFINSKEVFTRKWISGDILERQNIRSAVFPDFPDANIFQSHRKLSVLTFLMRFGPEAGFLIKQFKQI